MWSAPQPTKLLNPDSKTHAIRLRGPQGLLLLAYNNHDRPFHGMAKGRTSVSGKRRDTLMMAVSPDKGESWKQVRLQRPSTDQRQQMSFAGPQHMTVMMVVMLVLLVLLLLLMMMMTMMTLVTAMAAAMMMI